MAKEEEKIRVSLIKKRYGKTVTILEGMSKDVDVKKVLKQLKTKLACGGTYKNGTVELQGDHKSRVKDLLVKLGFQSDKIDVS